MSIDPDDAIKRALAQIAPEADLDLLTPEDELPEALDLDSMDFLNFLIALAHTTGVEIPERDYAQVRSYGGCRDYLLRHAVS